MSLTDHFRRLAIGALVDEAFLAAISQALHSRLRRAGLLDLPPAYLGYGERMWSEALADAALDCYLEAVVRRYDSLQDHLKIKPNIDGLILLNIDRFILARQKANDPVGYSTFKNLEAALCGMQEAKVLSLDGPKVRSATVVRFPGGADLAGRDAVALAMSADPAWDTAYARQAKIGAGAQRLLAAALRTLLQHGIEGFRVGDLLDPLKARAADAHAMRTRVPEQGIDKAEVVDRSVGEIIRMVLPDRSYSDAGDSFRALAAQLRRGIEGLDLQERTRSGISSLLEELLRLADSDEEIPSWAELARRLGAGRATLWEHVERIRDLAESLLR